MIKKLVFAAVAFFVLRFFFRWFAVLLTQIDAELGTAFSWMFP